jgi:two-component system, sensor histidine kinase and response regulator
MNYAKRILIADDDPDILHLLTEVLKQGREILLARDGEDAFLICHSHPPDLVITDNHMPRLNGEELIDRIKARWPELPILMVSSGARPNNVPEENFIRKPITDFGTLQRKVASLLPK